MSSETPSEQGNKTQPKTVQNPAVTYWHRDTGKPERPLDKEELRQLQEQGFPGEYWYEGLNGWTKGCTHRHHLVGYWVRPVGSDGDRKWVSLARMDDFQGSAWEFWWPGSDGWTPAGPAFAVESGDKDDDKGFERFSLEDAEKVRELINNLQWSKIRSFLIDADSALLCQSRASLLEKEGLVKKCEEAARSASQNNHYYLTGMFEIFYSYSRNSIDGNDSGETRIVAWGPLNPWSSDVLQHVIKLWEGVLKEGTPEACRGAINALRWADRNFQQETPFAWDFSGLLSMVRTHGHRWGLCTHPFGWDTRGYWNHCARLLEVESCTREDASDLVVTTARVMGPRALKGGWTVATSVEGEGAPVTGRSLLRESLSNTWLLDLMWNEHLEVSDRIDILSHAEDIRSTTAKDEIVNWYQSAAVTQWLLNEPAAWSENFFRDFEPIACMWRAFGGRMEWHIAPSVASKIVNIVSASRFNGHIRSALKTLSEIAKEYPEVGRTLRSSLNQSVRREITKKLTSRASRTYDQSFDSFYMNWRNGNKKDGKLPRNDERNKNTARLEFEGYKRTRASNDQEEIEAIRRLLQI